MVQLQHPPIQLGKSPWVPGLGLAEPCVMGRRTAELPESCVWQPSPATLPASGSQSRPALAPLASLAGLPGRDRVPASVMARVQREGMPQGQMDGESEKQ